MDCSGVITACLPALNAASTADLVFWTEGELYTYLDERLKHLARTAQVLVDRLPIAGQAGTAEYSLPAAHVSTIYASYAGVALRPATLAELDALGPQANSTPRRFAPGLGIDSIRLSPAPNAPAQLDVIAAATLPDVTVAAPNAAIPTVLAGYLELAVLAGARGRDGDGIMPDVAAHCEELMDLWERAAIAYWGPCQ